MIEPNEIDRQLPEEDNSKWIWGIFYFNRNDKRLFPPKREHWMGWTVNFANPYSIISMTTILVIAIYCISHFLIRVN
jgi:uncharacterized membrane protein